MTEAPYRSHPLEFGTAPEWADGWGQDEFGPFVEITIEGDSHRPVTQRLRWCPPGEFEMGSPTDESGRYENEGPQHVVRLSQGYWLFDTPVTQAFWQAVMGDNPSRFVSPDRPVEQVSFETVQRFLGTINTQRRGLELALPTEAQWEYACRAGTTAATYAGDIEILGENNAPILHEIAWYGGNSSQGFELDNGYDSSGWTERAFEGKVAGSHPVAHKRANPWGLYDTLGNVWEWCSDGERNYGETVSVDIQEVASVLVDPIGPSTGARAVRGGSWVDVARRTRAAYRDLGEPDCAGHSLGFRCLRVQEA